MKMTDITVTLYRIIDVDKLKTFIDDFRLSPNNQGKSAEWWMDTHGIDISLI
jgi:hypothetical protein